MSAVYYRKEIIIVEGKRCYRTR